MSDAERLMMDVQKAVYQNEDNGMKLWEYIFETMPDEAELSDYLKKQSTEEII